MKQILAGIFVGVVVSMLTGEVAAGSVVGLIAAGVASFLDT